MDQRAMEQAVWNYLRGTLGSMTDDELCEHILRVNSGWMTTTKWDRLFKAIESVQIKIDRHSPPGKSSK